MCKSVMNINVPEATTKQLKLQSCPSGRKLTISTNWLPLFGFESGKSRVVEELIGVGKGIRVRLANKDDIKTKKVYQRSYSSRKSNPLEVQLDIRSQRLLDEAFPTDTENVHIVFRKGEITITPVSDKKAEAIKKFKSSKTPLSTFLACSSGVDGYLLSKDGFEIETLLEYRPMEARDKGRDLTETGALNALNNFGVKHLINEDILNIDIDRIAGLTQESEHTFFHCSLQCDDFSNAKANSLKEKSLDETTSTLDMALDALNIIQKFNFPVILIEQVRGFASSDVSKLVKLRLQRLGYSITDEIMDARDYSGLTSRVRYYMVASLLPTPFSMPEKTQREDAPIWDKHIQPLIDKGHFRIPSSTKSLEDGIKCKRARVIDATSTSIGTLLKSQERMAKDSVFAVDKDNQIWFPKLEALKYFMGIDEGFKTETVSNTIATEIVGQSVEVPLHLAIVKSIKEHILSAHNALNGKLF